MLDGKREVVENDARVFVSCNDVLGSPPRYLPRAVSVAISTNFRRALLTDLDVGNAFATSGSSRTRFVPAVARL